MALAPNASNDSVIFKQGFALPDCSLAMGKRIGRLCRIYPDSVFNCRLPGGVCTIESNKQNTTKIARPAATAIKPLDL